MSEKWELFRGLSVERKELPRGLYDWLEAEHTRQIEQAVREARVDELRCASIAASATERWARHKARRLAELEGEDG